MDDFRPFAVALEQLGADLRDGPPSASWSAALPMSCSRPQRRASVAVQADLFGHHAGQERHFDRVPQHVLAVAGAEPQPAQQVDHLLVQPRHVGFLRRLLAELLDVLLHLLLRLGDDLFDPRRDGCGRRRSAC